MGLRNDCTFDATNIAGVPTPSPGTASRAQEAPLPIVSPGLRSDHTSPKEL